MKWVTGAWKVFQAIAFAVGVVERTAVTLKGKDKQDAAVEIVGDPG